MLWEIGLQHQYGRARQVLERLFHGSWTKQRILNGFWTDFEWILNGSWTNPERILNGSWTDLERIFKGFFNGFHTAFEWILNGFWADLERILNGSWTDLGRILKWPGTDLELILWTDRILITNLQRILGDLGLGILVVVEVFDPVYRLMEPRPENVPIQLSWDSGVVTRNSTSSTYMSCRNSCAHINLPTGCQQPYLIGLSVHAVRTPGGTRWQWQWQWQWSYYLGKVFYSRCRAVPCATSQALSGAIYQSLSLSLYIFCFSNLCI